jgi:hypothetical protein
MLDSVPPWTPCFTSDDGQWAGKDGGGVGLSTNFHASERMSPKLLLYCPVLFCPVPLPLYSA